MEKKKRNTEESVSRRMFLNSAAKVAAGFMIVPSHVLGGPNHIAPSDQVQVGVVGVGGRGRKNVIELLKEKDVRISAIADPARYWNLADFYYRSEAGRAPVAAMIEADSAQSRPAEYEDFRDMLDQEESLDAVLCATPDHTHAYVSIKAMQAGKHVYCEKPLTHNIWEARRVSQLAQETGLATQMGNQRHSTPGVRRVVDHLRSGILGDIREVHAWVPATRWINELVKPPHSSASPVPYGFNWDLWLGPRSYRPFHDWYSPVTWRDFWDFGCGALGDFGCHDMDAATWGLDLALPTKIQVRPAGFSSSEITPYGEIGYYEFPHPDGGSIKLNWHSGGLKPRRPDLLPDDVQLPRRGEMYIGEHGIMVVGGPDIVQLFPESLATGDIEETIAPTKGHHRDWIDAIKGGDRASSHFEYGAHLTEITLLGVLSLRLGGQEIHWDAKAMKAKGLPAADQYIQEPVRAGWEME